MTARPLRILIVHNEYQQRGGEDEVVAHESRLLREAGHAVELWKASNHSIRGLRGKLEAALRAPYSERERERLSARLAERRPDLVHVHNFFPLLTPSIYDACADHGVPVVQTLHNFRLTCANALLYRDGHPCELCVRGSPYQGVRHRCYRGSALTSLPVARMIARHRSEGTWNRKVARFIALTEFARAKLIEAGLEAERIAVKPNFLPAAAAEPVPRGERSGALFVGRLSEEKGIRLLLEAWRDVPFPLRIAGDGPLLGEVEAAARLNPRIKALGRIGAEQVAAEMRQARLLVVPSLWYEGFPMVLVEAKARALPALVAGHGSLSELVEDGRTGSHFRPGSPEDLARVARAGLERPEELERQGEAARMEAGRRYSPGANLELLEAIYARALGR